MTENSGTHVVYLSLGSNLGNRRAHMEQGLQSLARSGKLVSTSRYYETSAWGYEDPNPYLNMACLLVTLLSPEGLREAIAHIEGEAGRLRNSDHSGYSARTLDIDILLYDNLICESATLTIPHKAMTLRKFVLVPLAEIAPEVVHPVLGKSIFELLRLSTDPIIPTIFQQ